MVNTRDNKATPGSDAAVPAGVRYPTAIAVGGGVVAAVGSSFIPMNAIEGFVGAYGIAELLPAAAPPLGNTARLALSAGIGTLTAGALLALLPRGETEDMRMDAAVTNNAPQNNATQSDGKPSTGASAATPPSGGSKLAGWLRTLRFGKTETAPGHITDFGDISKLRVRGVDQHPDAPVRAPIMASSDLGAPLDAAPDVMPASLPERQPLPVMAAPFELDASMTVDPAIADKPAPERSPRFSPRMTLGSLFEPSAAPSEDTATPSFKAPGIEEPVREEPAFNAPVSATAVLKAPMVEQPQVPPTYEPDAGVTAFTPAPAVETGAFTSDDTKLVTGNSVNQAETALADLSIAGLLERLEAGLARRQRAATHSHSAISGFGAADRPDAEPTAPNVTLDTTSRIVPLNRLAAEPEPAAPADRTPTPQQPASAPMRFRLGNVQEDGVPPVAGPATPVKSAAALFGHASWGNEVEYHPPTVPEPASFEQTPLEATPVPSIQTPAEDDMDAALRDALATLRQLSDRQRNI